jgi:hypothetical protein
LAGEIQSTPDLKWFNLKIKHTLFNQNQSPKSNPKNEKGPENN